MTKAAASTEQISKRALEERWGEAAIAAGYTVLPSIILKRQKKLGLDALDVNILMHLLSYWWKGGALPFPSKNVLAEAIGVDKSTIRRRFQRLEKCGFVKRIQRHGAGGVNKSNQYDPAGLIKTIKPFAEEEVEEIKKRQAKKEQQVASKKPPVLKVVK